MDNLEEFYEAYGESLATRLAAIGHQPGRKRFIYAEEVGNPVEVVTAAKNELNGNETILVWERFEETTGDGGRDNFTSWIMGSFAVLQKAGTDKPSQRLATNQCRKIALKVFALMLRDEYEGTLSELGVRVRFDQQAGEKSSIAGWYGYGFTFDWTVGLDLELSDDDVLAI